MQDFTIFPHMKEIKLYSKLEDFTIEYEINQLSPSIQFDDQIQFIDHSISSVREMQTSVNEKLDLLTAHFSELDCSVSVVSGIISGLIDSVFVGEFSLDRGASWGNDKVNSFVKWVAKKQGYEGDSIAGAVSHLERNNKIAADLVTDQFGGGNFHHLNDFSHHPTLVGLFFSMLTQFTGYVYGTKVSSLITHTSPMGQGAFMAIPVPESELIGRDIPSKITLGFTKWIFHMVSDMAGSSGSIYKGKYGTGLPGPIVSLLKEISSLPIFQNKEGTNDFSKWISKLFNGTLFSEHDKNGKIIPETLIKFDLRAEIGVGYEIARQTFPVVVNECIVRSYYFISRFVSNLKCLQLKNWSDFKQIYNLPWSNILPRTKNNRTLTRMLTIACGTFTAIDIADASIRSAILSGANPAKFAKQFVLRVNFVGIGRLAIACYVDVEMGVERWKETRKLEQLVDTELHLTTAKLYYCQGQEKIYEIAATNAVKELTTLAESSTAYILESMNVIENANIGITKSITRMNDEAPAITAEIKEILNK